MRKSDYVVIDDLKYSKRNYYYVVLKNGVFHGFIYKKDGLNILEQYKRQVDSDVRLMKYSDIK